MLDTPVVPPNVPTKDTRSHLVPKEGGVRSDGQEKTGGTLPDVTGFIEVLRNLGLLRPEACCFWRPLSRLQGLGPKDGDCTGG